MPVVQLLQRPDPDDLAPDPRAEQRDGGIEQVVGIQGEHALGGSAGPGEVQVPRERAKSLGVARWDLPGAAGVASVTVGARPRINSGRLESPVSFRLTIGAS